MKEGVHPPPRKTGPAADILLTGATGIVGSRILMEILRHTESDCHCLVRAGANGEAHERIAGMLKAYGMEAAEYRRYRLRVIPVPGDLTLERFGLDGEAYNRLAQRVSLVIHMAADVNMVASFPRLRETNVEGTDRIVKFCLQGDCPLAYGSTYGVIGDRIYDGRFVFGEDEGNMGQKFPESNYPRTKLEAEQQIHRADSQGLRSIILRYGDVMGDSLSGAYPLNGKGAKGIYYDVLKTIIETGIAPFSEDRFYITPVDFAARATLYLALKPEAYRSTFHIVNSDQPCFYEITNLLIECGYSLRTVPLVKYVQLFGKNRVWRNGKVYQSIFTRMMSGLPPLPGRVESARISVTKAERLLSPAGIRCPSTDYNLMATYLNFCIESGYLPSPAVQRPLAEIR